MVAFGFLSFLPHLLNRPWSVLGDFNQTLFPDEDSNADQFPSNRGMCDFSQCVMDVGIQDLQFCGSSFTWSNNQGLGIISKKLDKILVNDKWLEVFPNALGYLANLVFLITAPVVSSWTLGSRK